MRLIISSIVAVTALVAGCTSSDQGASNLTDDPQIQDVDCGDKKLFQYRLDESQTPSPDDLSAQLGISGDIQIIPPSKTAFMRLDFCGTRADWKYTSLELKRVLLTHGGVEEIISATVTNTSRVEGVLEYFNHDRETQLLVQVDVDSDADQFIQVKSHQDLWGISTTKAKKVGNESVVDADPVIFGYPRNGDPIANLQCDKGDHQKLSFTIDEAKFDLERCTYMGGGHTTGYDVLSLEINDPQLESPLVFSKEEIANTDQSRTDCVDKDGELAPACFKWNHHNACDSFLIQTKDVTYAVSSAPIAGCGSPVPLAPKRQFEGDNMISKAVIRRGENWQALDLQCSHYMTYAQAAPAECAVSSRSDIEDPTQTFQWIYTNHQWNEWKFSVSGYDIHIHTPEGDNQDPDRNETWGWRPKVNYNAYQVVKGDETYEKSTWQEDVDEDIKSVHCRRVSQIYPSFEERQFLEPALQEFGLEEFERDSCSWTEIVKPRKRPNASATGDLICMFSPFKDFGEGPKSVVLYVEMRYQEETPIHWLDEWPIATASACVDQERVHLLRQDP